LAGVLPHLFASVALVSPATLELSGSAHMRVCADHDSIGLVVGQMQGFFLANA
jgi:hypothetical protein